MLTPHVVSTFKTLKKRGVMIVVVSTHPHAAKEADALLKAKIRHFGLGSFVAEAHAARA